MLPPNIVYGHSFPRINDNNNSAITDHHQKDIIHHHFPQHHHPMFFVDGVWHRMPIAPFILPEMPLLFPPPLLEDIFDYNNAIHIEADDIDVLGEEIQLSEYGLRRLTSNEITEDDLAFLKSADKILCTMEESSIESSKESSPLLLSPPPSANSSNFSPIFLSSSSPNLIPPCHSRKPTTAKRTSTRKSLLKPSPSKRTYRKSSATTTHYSNEHFPKLCTAASLPPRPRKQPPPLCVPSLDISRGFVGFCNVLKVNPYYAGCTGRVTTFKDEINHTYFVCANCGTRRRYMEKSNSNSSVLD